MQLRCGKLTYNLIYKEILLKIYRCIIIVTLENVFYFYECIIVYHLVNLNKI